MGNKQSLVVGLSTFPGEPLPGAANDVKLWCDLLSTVGFNPTPLLNPTKQELLQALKGMLAAPGNYLFVYAGHGTEVGSGDSGIVAMRQGWSDRDFVITEKELNAIAEAAPSGSTVTVILDCCDAEGVSTPGAGVYAVLDNVIPERVHSRFLRLPETGKGKSRREDFRRASLEKASAPGRLDIDATNRVLEARERSGLDGTNDFYGIFSFYATRALTANPSLCAADLRDQIAADVRAASDGQEVTVPTKNGREKEPFLTI